MNLLPHRYPFHFVDEIIRADANEFVGTKTFSWSEDQMLTGSFPEFDFVPGMIIVESMGQCGGAGIKKAGLAHGFFGLVSRNDVKFFKGVHYGKEIKYIIKNIRVSHRLTKQTGIAHTNNEPIAQATWVCARIDK